MHRRLFVILILIVSCAKERPIRHVVPNGKRLEKATLAGTYVYLRSLTEVQYAPQNAEEVLAPGIYLDNNRLVQFVIKENALEIMAINPLYREESTAEKNRVLARFPVRHVDILRKQNPDGRDTHEEEETETRRTWQEREYIVVDFTKNEVDIFKDTKSTTPPEKIELDSVAGVINFDIHKRLKDDTLITEHYSFLKHRNSSTYVQRPYPRLAQERFGFFKTTTYQFDRYGRITRTAQEDFINRWDLSRTITFYFSSNFPSHLKEVARQVFQEWNQILSPIVGSPAIELRENSGQKLGDLRYNLLAYHEPLAEHGILGYAPAVSNPRTGEILKGDVHIYSTLRQALYNEKEWLRLLGNKLNAGELKSDKKPSRKVPYSHPLNVDRELSIFGSLRPASLELLSQLSQQFEPKRALRALREEGYQEYAQRITRLSDDVRLGIRERNARKELTEEELETLIFRPLLAHELGHVLGLKHNFMGAADDRHVNSTVMGYGFLRSQQSSSPGNYDRTAITLAYSRENFSLESIFAKDFFYCTDENLFDARNGLCFREANGKTLVEATQNQIRRYAASYFFNNKRLDRIHFDFSLATYQKKIWSYLVPLRLTFDHANAILEQARNYRNAAPDPERKETELRKLWYLLRQRLEAAPDTQNVEELGLPAGVKVRLDLAKLNRITDDAQRARELAFSYLALIIQDEDEERPNYDTTDRMFNEVERKGVLPDKLLSLLLVSAQTPDPLSDGNGVRLMDSLHEPVAKLFAGLLSNTETQTVVILDPTGGSEMKKQTVTKLFDYHLRELILQLVHEALKVPGLFNGELKELFKLQQVTTLDPDTVNIGTLKQLHQDACKLLAEQHGSPDDKEIAKKIEANRKQTEALSIATIEVRDGLMLKAPLRLEQFGAIPTASGHFLRDNLNILEDRVCAARAHIDALNKTIAATPNPQMRAPLIATKRTFEDLVLRYTQYLETEKIFVERMYRFYSPR